MVGSSLLIGDIGGTNARFALADQDAHGFSHEKTLQSADYASAESAITTYLHEVGAAAPSVICLAAAGPVVDECVNLTNSPWNISAKELAGSFSTDAICLLNDFEAVAYSIPLLASDDCSPIGPLKTHGLDKSGYTVGALGPGTGLGKVGLVNRGGELITLSGEAGHTGFAPETEVQLEILKTLRERFDRVSTECVVSGPGIENIYWALVRLRTGDDEQLNAASIFARAKDTSESIANEAVQVFFEILGQVAGDLAMSLGAIDGIYIAGGIAQRYPELLTNSKFRNGFENKGPHREIMKRIPTHLIMHPEPGLLGASYVALELFRGTEVMPTS